MTSFLDFPDRPDPVESAKKAGKALTLAKYHLLQNTGGFIMKASSLNEFEARWSFAAEEVDRVTRHYMASISDPVSKLKRAVHEEWTSRLPFLAHPPQGQTPPQTQTPRGTDPTQSPNPTAPQLQKHVDPSGGFPSGAGEFQPGDNVVLSQDTQTTTADGQSTPIPAGTPGIIVDDNGAGYTVQFPDLDTSIQVGYDDVTEDSSGGTAPRAPSSPPINQQQKQVNPVDPMTQQTQSSTHHHGEQMCCKGDGMTAADHRAMNDDGHCCTDPESRESHRHAENFEGIPIDDAKGGLGDFHETTYKCKNCGETERGGMECQKHPGYCEKCDDLIHGNLDHTPGGRSSHRRVAADPAPKAADPTADPTAGGDPSDTTMTPDGGDGTAPAGGDSTHAAPDQQTGYIGTDQNGVPIHVNDIVDYQGATCVAQMDGLLFPDGKTAPWQQIGTINVEKDPSAGATFNGQPQLAPLQQQQMPLAPQPAPSGGPAPAQPAPATSRRRRAAIPGSGQVRKHPQPFGSGNMKCRKCGGEDWIDQGRSLDSHNLECANCGNQVSPPTETGMSARKRADGGGFDPSQAQPSSDPGQKFVGNDVIEYQGQKWQVVPNSPDRSGGAESYTLVPISPDMGQPHPGNPTMTPDQYNQVKNQGAPS